MLNPLFLVTKGIKAKKKRLGGGGGGGFSKMIVEPNEAQLQPPLANAVHSSVRVDIFQTDHTNGTSNIYTDPNSGTTYGSLILSDVAADLAGVNLNYQATGFIHIDSVTQSNLGNHVTYNIYIEGGINAYVGGFPPTERVELVCIYENHSDVANGNITINPQSTLLGKNSFYFDIEIDNTLVANSPQEIWFEIKEVNSSTNSVQSMNTKPISATAKDPFYMVLLLN